jgi:hypothetical protein
MEADIHMTLTDVFCKHFLDKVAKYFWALLQVQIGQSCKGMAAQYWAGQI